MNTSTTDQIFTAATRPAAAPIAKAHGSEPDITAPLAAATSGRLVFVPGASQVTIDADPALPDLYRARFDGEAPHVRAENGTITIRYPRHSIVDWVRDALRRNDHAARVVLNGTIPWRIEVDGGVSRLTADLRRLRLEALAAAAPAGSC
jgi:hypothetical protein